ncbi:hypothetical protein AB0C34_23180 [Nocardia sp. NPDC049220]|uniref:hypothetical protein n=1 Tax=Nocardia sp. NPDC049220 TaxID=3155273 RepID=UPI0033DD3184
MKVFLTGGSGYIGRATITDPVPHRHTIEVLVRSDVAGLAGGGGSEAGTAP